MKNKFCNFSQFRVVTFVENKLSDKYMKLPHAVNVLLLGSGGREHAIAKKISESQRVAKLYIATGNGGTASCGINVPDFSPVNFGGIKQFVISNNINLVVVGPEEPLVKGIADYFQNDSDIYHVPVIGPSMAGARLEGSKAFAKDFMMRHGIPTAAYRSFSKDCAEDACKFLETLEAPYVLKADGLAAGKGVLIENDIESAKEAVKSMKESINQVSSGEILGEGKAAEDEGKEEKEEKESRSAYIL